MTIPDELELKAAVDDPESLAAHLLAAGAATGYCGLMEDRRFDRRGELEARNEVLRVRTYRGGDAAARVELSWKGPTHRSPEGYKVRQEQECAVSSGSPARLLESLGYRVVHAIDRYVEHYGLGGAVLRIEWYPRMDVLLEIEGTPAAIEAAVRLTGLPRARFSADALAEFVVRYEARTGRAAILSLAQLGESAPESAPEWEGRWQAA